MLTAQKDTHLLRRVALLDERGPDWARCDSIHPDTPADQVRPKALCESSHGPLHVNSHHQCAFARHDSQ